MNGNRTFARPLAGQARVRLCACVGVLVACGLCVHAQASGEAELSWQAPGECPDSSYVLSRVREHLAMEAQIPAWRAVARIRKERAGYRLDVEVTAGDATAAQRSLRASTCRALADAAAVLIALAVEPQPSAADDDRAVEVPDATSQPQAAEAPAPSEVAAPRASPAANSAPVRSTARESAGDDEGGSNSSFDWPMRVELGVALRLDVGTFPQRPGAGVQPHVALRVGPLRARGGLTVFLPGDGRSGAYPSAVVHGRALLGDFAAGVAITGAPLRLTPEVMLEHGELEFEVTQIRDPERSGVGWTALGTGVHAAYVLPFDVELTAGVAGLWPTSRPRPVVHTSDGDVPVFTVSAFLLRFSLGATYVFP